MHERIYNRQFLQRCLKWRRRKRVEYFLSKVETFPGMKILDIGCGQDGRSFENFVSNHYVITGIDIIEENTIQIEHPQFRYIKRSAEDLSVFSDNEFDLVVSIGMLEHICDQNILKKMITEMIRVSNQFVIVVPWKYSIMEPHFKFPVFQLFPPRVQNLLVTELNLHGLKNRILNDPEYIEKYYQWLTRAQWSELFLGVETHINPTFDTISIVGTSKSQRL